ncbi:MAG: hypothetical protein FWF15_00410 [Oscillospiraceae bacterium]|nr:hypothetical protein [Oscillospiraceae bacterium]
MLNFLKENSYSIVKMMIYQFGLTVFGFMLSMSVGQNEFLQLVASIFAIIFYLFLLYSMTWTVGSKDHDKVSNKRAPYVPANGLYMSMVANAINFLAGIFMFTGYIVGGKEGTLYGVWNMITKLIQAMYLGLSINIPDEFHFIMYLLTPFPAIFICGLAYYLGVKDISILKLLGINTNNKKK